MIPERQPLDLSEIAKNHSIEAGYVVDFNSEPTTNLIPLEAALDINLAKIVKTEDDELYVVTPTVIRTKQDKEAFVAVVSTIGREQMIEKEITTYNFGSCTACGGPLTKGDGKKSTQEHIHCGYCSTMNQGIAKPEKMQIRKYEIEDITEEEAWIGTVQKLTKESEKSLNNRLKPLHRFMQLISPDEDMAPLQAIEAGKDMVTEEEKIDIFGPFSEYKKNNLFVKIGRLQRFGKEEKKNEKTEEKLDEDKLYPRTPGSYVVDSVEGITDMGDYIVTIESDSGNVLPLVVMNDRDEIPNRFVVPLNALTRDGWNVSIKHSDLSLIEGKQYSLNEIVAKNNLQTKDKPFGLDTMEFGIVKIFWWNNNSERHDAITSELVNYDYDYDKAFVSAEVPNGDVSSLEIEQTK